MENLVRSDVLTYQSTNVCGSHEPLDYIHIRWRSRDAPILKEVVRVPAPTRRIEGVKSSRGPRDGSHLVFNNLRLERIAIDPTVTSAVSQDDVARKWKLRRNVGHGSNPRTTGMCILPILNWGMPAHRPVRSAPAKPVGLKSNSFAVNPRRSALAII